MPMPLHIVFRATRAREATVRSAWCGARHAEQVDNEESHGARGGGPEMAQNDQRHGRDWLGNMGLPGDVMVSVRAVRAGV